MSRPQDEQFMRQALRLARSGRGRTSPNPMVGAVVVKRGRIVGQGYHRQPGGPHAEVIALRAAGRKTRGATLYVNLEPCCFQGRTPPCTRAILHGGIARVVCATPDPNPRVSGKGLARLRSAGIEVCGGLFEKQARELNEIYFKYIQTGRPFVTAKIAQTLDGRIAAVGGDSRWVSSLPSRRLVHRLRAEMDAVLVGVGTVRQDDPLLNVRYGRGRDPVKIILDSRLRTPLRARVLSSGRTIMATCRGAEADRVRRYRDLGAEVWQLPPDKTGRVDLGRLFTRLGKNEITSVLVEGGTKVFTTAIRLSLVDKLMVFVSPRLLGAGRASLGELGIRGMADAVPLTGARVRRVGADFLITGRM
jgi:diaminohydroxyphosphoribosylaminopyrimidine deaminase/5-amino-6-(5-phosphoribosylamino)uracil reductase